VEPPAKGVAMDYSEKEWRVLCLKIANEKDPIRLAVWLTKLDEMLDSHLEDLKARKRSGIDEIGLSRHVQ
jgi:hypothetical protein